MTGNTEQGRTIQSDERLFDIIECIHEEGKIGVTEVAATLDMSKSTVHGHLTALRRRGYAVKDGGKYRLGLEFLNYGKDIQNSYDIYEIAQEKVDHLAAETGERTWYMVEENGLAYYLAGAGGEHPVHLPVQMGQGAYLHSRSAGKAMLAELSRDRVEEIISRHGLLAETENTITDRDALFAELEDVRENRYGINDEESFSGVYAIGAAVHDEDGNVRGALSISGPKNRLNTEERRRELINTILGATNELEINLRSYSM